MFANKGHFTLQLSALILFLCYIKVSRDFQHSLLTPNRSSISTIHVRHSGVVSGWFCSLDLTPLDIRALHCVTIALNHERHVTLVVVTTVTYALVHGAAAAIGAEFSCVYSADKSNVVAYSRVVTNWLDFEGWCGWCCGYTWSCCLAEGAYICRNFF